MTSLLRPWGRWLAAVCWLLLFAAHAVADDANKAAYRLYLTGKYAEAQTAYEALAASNPAQAAVGVARCLEAVGQYTKAQEAVEAALDKSSSSAELKAELALLLFERGTYDRAASLAREAIQLDRKQLAARHVEASVLRAQGKLEAAGRAYEWFVDYYNDNEITDPDAIRWVALGSATYARWNRLSDQFSFLVNELLPEAIAANDAYWPAHYEAGLLFLEKYNEADALREFQAALAINPRAAVVHAALGQLALEKFDTADAKAAAERALEINPKLLEAYHLQADIHLNNVEPDKAAEILRVAMGLNPQSPGTLGRLAAAYAAMDGFAGGKPGPRARKIIDDVTKRNPHAGDFHFALADGLESLRRFPAAARYYREAADRMPQLDTVLGRLGMIQMRLGDEAEAKKLLAKSFEADPFNVRVSNTLDVLEVLDDYATLETKHFIIKYDPKKDALLAKYIGKFLEEIYPQLCRQFGYEPPEKSLFEIFNDARNTDGHSWFSARMVGLARVHTIGACAGKMVAMQSPSAGRKPFNWARVMKHEFIHVLNLQQTDFNIPHWYTEALAVLNEDAPRPREWSRLLVKSSAADKLFDLDSINFGFIRPHSSDEWTLAYCQAELYAEYMLERFGPDALSKLLAAYAANLSTPDALKRAFGVDPRDFEQGYRAHVKKVVAQVHMPAATAEKEITDVESRLKADPDNADLLARLALSKLARESYADARRQADAALKVEPKHQLAAYVRARIHLLVGEDDEAAGLLERTLDEQAPEQHALELLAEMRLKAGRYDDAARLYEVGVKHFAGDDKWVKALARCYLKAGDMSKLAPVLGRLALQEPDDHVVRKKLATIALDTKDFEAARRWATEVLHIDVTDAESHHVLAKSLLELKKPELAAEEFAVAAELQPDKAALQFELAQALLAAGQPRSAKQAIERVLKLDPKYPEAESLLKSIRAQ